MASCDILDIRCLFVSELIGSVTLTIVLFAIFYFIIASKMRFGFDTTVLFAIPILLIISLALGGFAVVYALSGFITAIILSWIFQRIIGNR